MTHDTPTFPGTHPGARPQPRPEVRREPRPDPARGRRVLRAPHRPPASSVPPATCLYTPSADPSGMGQHMLDLAACLLERGTDVTLMAWPTDPGRRLLERAAAAGAVPVALPHPRDPGFAAAIATHLRRRHVAVFHAHVGTGRENFDGARAARAAGVPAVVQTLHLPWMLSERRKRDPFFAAIADVDHLVTVSEAQRATYLRIGVPPGMLSTVPNGVRPRGGPPPAAPSGSTRTSRS
ncbi:glycosyltransferase [Nocardioides sp. ChNu-153]|uniref:glycosyltransferase family 4 protein n=1 Tax=unclassified Nocardioides TaxID=2615069 RepID=UPI002406267C|nr:MULTISPECIES: glycosyltransferase family 4 protein [unclassified Nocardioides]MDF9716851.1 glycosyltransferase [Nocardioides sp. ChNu-99]MDN7120237.1 glycosyltransferase [Nocardioides sp. ChNu-153]